LLLSNIDVNLVINYDKLITQNLESIQDNVLKPYLTKIMCMPNNLWNIFMGSSNIEDHQQIICNYMDVNKRNLYLLHYIKPIRNLVTMMVDSDALLDNKTYGEEGQIVPIHRLVSWEIIKYLYAVFKNIYIVVKKTELFERTNSHKTIPDTDDDYDMIDLSDFFDHSSYNDTSKNTTFHKQSNKIDFKQLEYRGGNTLEFLDLTKQPILRNPYSHLNFTQLTDSEKEIILSNFDIAAGFTSYEQLAKVTTGKMIIKRS